jgi:acetyl-CoA synthetase
MSRTIIGANEDGHGPIVWRPSPDLIAKSRLTAFMTRHGLSSLDELQRRSTSDIDWFWNAVLEDLDIRFTRPYTQVVDLSRGPAWARWCVGGEMNIVDNLLDRYAGTPTDAKVAIRAESEPPDGAPRALTYAELRHEVNRAAGLLRAHGIGRGDVVGVLMPLTPECVIAMLAIIKVGGVFLPLFSGYGVEAVAQRLEDAGAVALMTAEGFSRRGKRIDLRTTAEAAAVRVPGVKHVLLPTWSSYPDEAETTRTGADEPMMLIYTSGTTGNPKGTVHSHCGFPIKAAQDMAHGFDLHADETMCWCSAHCSLAPR